MSRKPSRGSKQFNDTVVAWLGSFQRLRAHIGFGANANKEAHNRSSGGAESKHLRGFPVSPPPRENDMRSSGALVGAARLPSLERARALPRAFATGIGAHHKGSRRLPRPRVRGPFSRRRGGARGKRAWAYFERAEIGSGGGRWQGPACPIGNQFPVSSRKNKQASPVRLLRRVARITAGNDDDSTPPPSPTPFLAGLSPLCRTSLR